VRVRGAAHLLVQRCCHGSGGAGDTMGRARGTEPMAWRAHRPVVLPSPFHSQLDMGAVRGALHRAWRVNVPRRPAWRSMQVRAWALPATSCPALPPSSPLP